jgi:F-type H+-transporting ATPase subunit epsilon
VLPFFVSGGILEVQPFVVSVLADRAVRAKDIDEAAAVEAKRRAEESLADRSGKVDYAKAQAELIEAMAQLQTLDRYRKNR